MKKKIGKFNVDLETKLSRTFSPDDALKFKLAVATRLIEKKEKSRLFANVIKKQLKDDMS